jgi:uncharacterized protein
MLMAQYKEYVDSECGKCSHIRYCRGGCPYNAIAPTNGEIKGVDPHCVAYKRIFDEISERLDREMFEEPPMEMAGFQPGHGKGKKPGVMALMRRSVSEY